VEKNGRSESLGTFDYVITAIGMRANTELKGVLEEIVNEVVYVGDALKAGNALDAIEEGYRAALTI